MRTLPATCISGLRIPSRPPRTQWQIAAARQLRPLNPIPIIRTIHDTKPASQDDGKPQHTPQQSPNVFQLRSLKGPPPLRAGLPVQDDLRSMGLLEKERELAKRERALQEREEDVKKKEFELTEKGQSILRSAKEGLAKKSSKNVGSGKTADSVPATRPKKGPRRPFPSPKGDRGPTVQKLRTHRVIFREGPGKEFWLLEKAVLSSQNILDLMARVGEAMRVLSGNRRPSADAKQEDEAKLFVEARVTANRVIRRTHIVLGTLLSELKLRKAETFKQRKAAQLERREGGDAAETKQGDGAAGNEPSPSG